MVEALRQRMGLGLLALLLSSASFGTSGPFAKALIEAGWAPPTVVILRIAGAAAVLLPWALWSMRGQWAALRRELPITVLYGALGVGAAQLGYFQAIERLPVGVALLLEFLGVVLVVLWMWLVTHRAPHRLTLLGVALALAGLALVLNITGALRPDLLGVLWGLVAAAGLAGHFVIAARETRIPLTAFAGLGLAAGGTVLIGLAALGILPMRIGGSTVVLARHQVPAWIAFAELIVIAAAAAYVLGIVGARHLGSTVASFVGLTEVLFAILFAWLLLAELPTPIQLVGGLLILAGVAAVRIGESRHGGSALPTDESAQEDADFSRSGHLP